MPASRSAPKSSDRLGGAWTWTSGGRTGGRGRSPPEVLVGRARRRCACIAVPGLGRKFWTITSCTWPYRRWASAMASSASTRSARSSPMPTRMPVVNGIGSSPRRLEGGQAPLGRLVRRPAVAGEVGAQRLEHHPLDGATGRSAASSSAVERTRRWHGGAGRSRPRPAGTSRRGSRPSSRSRARRASRGATGVALLGPLAQGEQRLVAAGGGAGAGDRQHLVGREVRRSSRAGGWAKVQYPHRSRHSMVSGMKTLGEYVTRVPWARRGLHGGSAMQVARGV